MKHEQMNDSNDMELFSRTSNTKFIRRKNFRFLQMYENKQTDIKVKLNEIMKLI